jgi:choline dehydrogenase
VHDVVVVGGGTAGCVVAARLAEVSSRSVLLLEAGPDRRTDLPPEMRDGWTIQRDAFDWGYTSQPHARGAVRPVRRKKLLGGTSWLTRFTPRGAPADYDGWRALGNPGWGFDDVLPWFVRLEADTDFGDRAWHGDSGPIPSTRCLEREPAAISRAAVQALADDGFAPVPDHNRPGAVGVGRMPMNLRDGRRVTTVDAYLPIAATPPNLTIRAEAEVDRVLFDDQGDARGVRLSDGTAVEAGWVVLCAGTFGSPAILLRSGVGPARHLREQEIEVVADLPGVGANLVDHPDIGLELGDAASGGAAPLHSIATFHSAGRPTSDTPDLMLWFSDPSDDDPSFFIEIVLLRPRSRGSVRLRSRVPTDPPLIELPNLSQPTDVERLAEGYRRALQAANHPAVQRLCDGEPPAEPEDLNTLIRREVVSLPHAVGTCAMGSRPDGGAVVDAAGLVHGVERLSVVDASIMPDVPSGFTHIPTIMLAERLADSLGTRL